MKVQIKAGEEAVLKSEKDHAEIKVQFEKAEKMLSEWKE